MRISDWSSDVCSSDLESGTKRALNRKIDVERLRTEKGLRITEQRRVIARVLSEAEEHPDVEKLHERASALEPGISIATVSRTVRLSEEAGILTPPDSGDGRDRNRRSGRKGKRC